MTARQPEPRASASTSADCGNASREERDVAELGRTAVVSPGARYTGIGVAVFTTLSSPWLSIFPSRAQSLQFAAGRTLGPLLTRSPAKITVSSGRRCRADRPSST
jgi:hypothetical protein